jgi:peptidoglycan LD-endopeptidase LytH
MNSLNGRTVAAMNLRRLVALALVVASVTACGSGDQSVGGDVDQAPADAGNTTIAASPTNTSATTATTTEPPPTTTTSTTTTTTTTTEPPPTTATSTTTEPLPTTTPYVVPVADVARAGWNDTHAGYPATDIFLACGAAIVSAVNGTVTEVRRVNSYDPAVDNPATRGGRSVTTIGDDGVRYYYAHFEEIADGLEVGGRVEVGQFLGTMGTTGRSSACHLHFAISPPCPGKEWSVRRGAVWPYPYLAAWRRGEQVSPADEVEAWTNSNPDACAEAMADPFAADG